MQRYSAWHFGVQNWELRSIKNEAKCNWTKKEKKLWNNFIDSNHHNLAFFRSSTRIAIWPNVLVIIKWIKCYIWKKAGRFRPIRTAFMGYQNFAFFPYHDISTWNYEKNIHDNANMLLDPISNLCNLNILEKNSKKIFFLKKIFLDAKFLNFLGAISPKIQSAISWNFSCVLRYFITKYP